MFDPPKHPKPSKDASSSRVVAPAVVEAQNLIIVNETLSIHRLTAPFLSRLSLYNVLINHSCQMICLTCDDGNGASSGVDGLLWIIKS